MEKTHQSLTFHIHGINCKKVNEKNVKFWTYTSFKIFFFVLNMVLHFGL